MRKTGSAKFHSRGRSDNFPFNSVRNTVLLVLGSVLIAIALLKISFVVVDRWGLDAFRWGGFAGFTLILFAYFVNASRRFIRTRRFWVVTAILLALHSAVFAAVLIHVQEWKAVWFMVMIFEFPVFLYIRDTFASPLR